MSRDWFGLPRGRMVEMEEGLEPGELRQSSPAEGEENEEGDRVSIEKLKLLGECA